MFLFFCDCLFQTEIRVLKRPVLVFFLFERNAVLHFFLKMVLGFRHENSTARLSCSLWPVVQSKLDFCLVISNGKLLFNACSVPKALRKNRRILMRYSPNPDAVLYIFLIHFATAVDTSGTFDQARGVFSKFSSSASLFLLLFRAKTFSFRCLLV